MIGIKSVSAIVLAATAVTIGGARGVFDVERFAHLSTGSGFAIGLFASVCAALVGFGWRPRIDSSLALALRHGRPVLVDEARHPRELPAVAQRLLLVVVFVTLGLTTFGNDATVRIGNAVASLARPSRSEYCQPVEVAPAQIPPAPGEPVEQAGCALVKRAFALGYAKSLGSCAPTSYAAAAPVDHAAEPRELCTRRQLDEPFLHYAYRKLAQATTGAAPIDALAARVEGVRTHLDYLGDSIADLQHAVTGTPHASHHLWVNLPDPRPSSWGDRFSGKPPCATRFADLPLWPGWAAATPPSRVLEHVFGQLLFATRFGTTASCSDYTIHWGAQASACTRLVGDPLGFLEGEGALAQIRSVLDRRRRQLAMHALAAELGQPPVLTAPPDARAVVSVGCLMFGTFDSTPGTTPTTVASRDAMIDGEPIPVRELHTTGIRATGGGPFEVYNALAALLGGTHFAGALPANAEPASTEVDLGDADFMLLGLEALADADPFGGADRWLERADLLEVYPFEHHVHRFVDAFRRVYLAQRGRL